MGETENKTKGLKRIIIGVFLSVFVAAVLATGFAYFVASQTQKATAKLSLGEQDAQESKFVDAKSQVLGVETSKSADAMAASENYKIKQVTFGGDFAVGDAGSMEQPQISDVRSELLMTKNQKDYRFLISWKTNKLTQSEIIYTKAGASEKSLKDSGYSLTHSVVLTQLDAAATYTYFIKATDQWGNSVKTDRYSMYTSEKSLSVFELITKEFTGLFGWAM